MNRQRVRRALVRVGRARSWVARPGEGGYAPGPKTPPTPYEDLDDEDRIVERLPRYPTNPAADPGDGGSGFGAPPRDGSGFGAASARLRRRIRRPEAGRGRIRGSGRRRPGSGFLELALDDFLVPLVRGTAFRSGLIVAAGRGTAGRGARGPAAW